MLDMLIGIGTSSFDLLAKMAPYLLFGIVIAGIIHVLIPVEWVARGLGGPGFMPVLRAALIGVPLPLCSCSVVPLTASLKKSGASNGATVSFLITTPTSGVDSIFATYSLLGGVFAVTRVVASFLIGLAAGVITAWIQPESLEQSRSASSAIRNAPNRLTRQNPIQAALSYGFSELLGGMAGSLALGIVLGGAVSYFMPIGFLEKTVGHGIWSYLAMTAFGIPLYVCASGSIPLAAALLIKGISPGAALVFLITGPATNAAVIAVISKMIGKRALAVFLGTLAAGAIGAGFLLDAFAGLFPLLMPNPAAICAHDSDVTEIVEVISAAVLGLMILFHLARPPLARVFAKKGANGMFQIRVPDMTCPHCAKTITDALRGLSGVKSIHADPSTKLVTVELDENVDSASVIQLISNAGYSPEKV